MRGQGISLQELVANDDLMEKLNPDHYQILLQAVARADEAQEHMGRGREEDRRNRELEAEQEESARLRMELQRRDEELDATREELGAARDELEGWKRKFEEQSKDIDDIVGAGGRGPQGKRTRTDLYVLCAHYAYATHMLKQYTTCQKKMQMPAWSEKYGDKGRLVTIGRASKAFLAIAQVRLESTKMKLDTTYTKSLREEYYGNPREHSDDKSPYKALTTISICDNIMIQDYGFDSNATRARILSPVPLTVSTEGGNEFQIQPGVVQAINGRFDGLEEVKFTEDGGKPAIVVVFESISAFDKAARAGLHLKRNAIFVASGGCPTYFISRYLIPALFKLCPDEVYGVVDRNLYGLYIINLFGCRCRIKIAGMIGSKELVNKRFEAVAAHVKEDYRGFNPTSWKNLIEYGGYKGIFSIDLGYDKTTRNTRLRYMIECCREAVIDCLSYNVEAVSEFVAWFDFALDNSF